MQEKEGLVFDAKDYFNHRSKITRTNISNIKILFILFFEGKFNKDKDKDLLFSLKLELFEYDVIKKSDNNKLQIIN